MSTVWQRHAWEGGFLGYPTTSDMALGNQWFKQYFQGGHVYTHNALPASQASIQGAIYDKWQSMGAQDSELGYPISIDDVWTMLRFEEKDDRRKPEHKSVEYRWSF